jgi:hypothetical protein
MQPKPAQILDELLCGLLRAAGQIGVFDAEQELSARMSRGQPTEQGGSRSPDVQVAGGRRGETGYDG